MDTLLLDSEDVETSAELLGVIDAVEAAFAAYARGDVIMPAKSYLDLRRYNGDFRSMPSYVDAGGWDAAGIKWVNVHPDNPNEHDLPTVMGTMIYSDPETAVPLSIMDGTVLTQKRTGAAAAVATQHLAIDEASSLGIVGAGAQSYTQLEAIAEVRPIEEVVIADRDADRQAAFVEAFADRFSVRTGSVEDAAGCDILSTITPTRAPIISREMVGGNTHINAIGADAAGKQELDPEILRDAKLVIDDYEQCVHSGEVNVPWSQGLLDDADIHAELGDIVTGEAAGRTSGDGLTVFDSTGLAIQDVAAAHVTYNTALENGAGTAFPLIGPTPRSPRPR